MPRTRLIALTVLGSIACGGPPSPRAIPNAAAPSYPVARKADAVDTYFGTKVADPYRWLENDNAKDTAEWVAKENALTDEALGKLPWREPLRQRLTELSSTPRRTAPKREAGKLYYSHNTGLEKQAVLYVQDAPTSPGRIVLDPNALSPDGALALSSWSVAPTGKLLAYGLSPGGSDWIEFHVRDLATGKDLTDKVAWSKYSDAAWTKDGKGFFYGRYPEPAEGTALQTTLRDERIYYHLVGTPQPSDQLVFALPDQPTYSMAPTVSEDGRLLFITPSDEITRNDLYVADLGDPMKPNVAAAARPIVATEDALYQPLGSAGATVFVLTDQGAPRRRIVAIDLAKPDRGSWRTIVPEGASAIESATIAGGQLVLHTLADARSRLALRTLDGEPAGDLPLPGAATVEELSARADTKELFVTLSAFALPRRVLRRDLTTGEEEPYFAPEVGFASQDYRTEEVFFTSKDGTRIPMFLTAKKTTKLDAPHPVLMYAYGGFGASVTPRYAPMTAAWLEMGGVYAVPALRGGGEYGEAWHQAGMRANKHNVFDDFIAAAEYLIRTKVTTPAQLAVTGRSNGGLLIGAVLTQRPELFAAAVAEDGVLDMLRFQRFAAGSFWVAEYGSSDDEAGFRTLLAYSPLHHLRPNRCYPATLIIAADHDDTVVPAHSFKFAATLQAAQACAHPTLLRVETQASHGYRPTDKQIARSADILAFVAAHVGLAR
jgi:prolyl oligopeptidase